MGSLFTDAFGGGWALGNNINDTIMQGRQRRSGGALSQLLRGEDFNGAAALMAQNGQTSEALRAAQIPLQQRRLDQQQEFRQQEFLSNQAYRQNQLRNQDRPNLPNGYMWNDPNDPSAGVNQLPGFDPQAGSSPENWTTPQEELDENGNPVVVRYSNRGNREVVEGATPAGSLQKIDTPTETILTNRYTGEVVSRTPKNNQQAAADKAFGGVVGKAQGENATLLSSMQSKLPGLKAVTDELAALADKATYTQAGQAYDYARTQAGFDPREEAIARTKYIAMVDNQVLPLLRDTFGAAFTKAEGDSLRATLGAADKSPPEKKAVLEAFINQKVRDVLALESEGLGELSAPAQTAGPRSAAENQKPINVPSPSDAGKTRESAIPVTSEQEAESLPSGSFFIMNGRLGRVK